MMPIVIAVLIDARKGLDDEAEAILKKLAEVRQPKVLILNKVDIVEKATLLALATGANERGKFAATFMISALTGRRRRRRAQHGLPSRCPPAPGTIRRTRCRDAPLRQLAAEITREKLYRPAAPGIAVSVDGRDRDLDGTQGRLGPDRADDLCRARQPEEDRARARADRPSRRSAPPRASEIAEIIETPVHLFLFVKVREGWGDDPERYRQMGLEFPKE